LKLDDGLLTCTLNRPEALNAVTPQVLRELGALWDEVADDSSVRAVLITGAGRAFCVGGDVRSMHNGQLDVAEVALNPYGAATWRKLAALPQPVISAVNGVTVGAGLFFLGLSDIVLATPEAQFGDPHVKLGLVASGAGILAPSIGLRHAKALMLMAEMIDAEEAHRIGLINKIVAGDELLDRATSLARKLGAYPPAAFRWSKRCMNRILEQTWNIAWDAELAFEALSASTGGHKAAAEAFANRPR
jgi:enoyl-CoA hydratase/carnithine racemase